MSENLKFPTDSVFFDGACPVCNYEINGLKSRACQLNFYNVHDTQTLPAEREEMLRYLHVVDKNGGLRKGLDANIYMWRKGHYPWLAKIVAVPGIYTVTRVIYNAWANYRYNKKYGKSREEKS